MLSALVVEDEPAVSELLSTWLESLGLPAREVKHGGEALDVLTQERIALIVTDLDMPVMDGFTFLRMLNRIPHAPPVVVITGSGDIGSAVKAMKLGARDFLAKPVSFAGFQAAVESALSGTDSRSHLSHIDESATALTVDPRVEYMVSQLGSADHSDALLEALVAALDAREAEAGTHSRRVCYLAGLLGQACGLGGDALTDLRRGALLHDLGKIGVSDFILRKPGPLTESEWAEMRLHPQIGARIIAKVDRLRPVTAMVLHHHERFDGKGYPAGLCGEAIPLPARIFSVVDTVDAMLSDRPYRLAKSAEETLRELRNCAGKQFDPEVVETFCGISWQQWIFWYDNRIDNR